MRCFPLTAALVLAVSIARAEPPITKIVLERTTCFGVCPVYTLTIQSSGRVDFVGTKHVWEPGPHRGKISRADFARLVNKIEEIHFFTLKNRYDGKKPDGSGPTVTDLPTRKTSVTRGSQTKTVENYFRGPPGLKELEDLIDEVTKSSIWITGDQ
jgi:hypothetical protein